MKSRVYGVLGVVSRMSNWNADFTGYPKTISTGEIFGSDKAFKYPIKKMWQEKGEKILYIKSMKLSETKKGLTELIPRSLKERYENIFEIELKKDNDSKEVLKNLFNATDVKNFGATFAEEGNNISITGAVQIGQGFNKYEESTAEEQQILSPFRDASKKANKDSDDEAKASTLGTKIVSDEAHYFYPFSINPSAYNDFIDLEVTDGYTEEDYKKFKEASLIAATSYATNAKIGCENEFAFFIETDKDLYLPDLSKYIEFEKGDKKDLIKINCGEIVNKLLDRIKSIEIYYNTCTVDIETDIESVKEYNIFTREEV